MLEQLRGEFHEFVSQLESSEDAVPEQILPPANTDQLTELESRLGVSLPASYKQFLRATRGFWLFGGAVQFGTQHPFLHEFPPLEDLSPAERSVVYAKGGEWPPPSQGMLCFAEYFLRADGDQVLFDVSGGLVGGEYPVVYYSHETRPPYIEKLADTFSEWLTHRCVDDMQEE